MIGRRSLLKLFSGVGTAAVVPRIRNLDMKPDDVFVLEVPERLSCSEIEKIKRQCAEHFGRDAGKIVILDGGASLKKISKRE